MGPRPLRGGQRGSFCGLVSEEAWPVGVVILAVDALADGGAQDARLIALAVLFEASGFSAVATTVVPAAGVLAVVDFWAEGLRIPLQSRGDGLHALFVVFWIVVARLAVAPEAVLTAREALAVQLQTSAVPAVARLALI